MDPPSETALLAAVLAMRIRALQHCHGAFSTMFPIGPDGLAEDAFPFRSSWVVPGTPHDLDIPLPRLPAREAGVAALSRSGLHPRSGTGV